MTRESLKRPATRSRSLPLVRVLARMRARSLGDSNGYGPPVPASTIVEDYLKIRTADSSRPVMLNLGQGEAWDGYYGRGVRTNHPEDYPEYIRGCDLVSFDIYPVAHSHPQISGNLWYVARGVERLVRRLRGEAQPKAAAEEHDCKDHECQHFQGHEDKASQRLCHRNVANGLQRIIP